MFIKMGSELEEVLFVVPDQEIRKAIADKEAVVGVVLDKGRAYDSMCRDAEQAP